MDLKTQFKKLKVLADEGALEEALKIGLELSQLFPNNSELQYATARLLYDTNRISEATVYLEVCMHHFDFNSGDAAEDLTQYLSIVGLALRTGSTASIPTFIKKHFQRIEWTENNLPQLTNLIEFSLLLEEPELALEILNEAISNLQGSSVIIEVLMLVATAAHAAEEEELELESYIRALEIDPLNEQVHSRLSRVLGKLKEWDLATDHIKFIQKINPDYKTKSIAQDYYNLSKSGAFEEQEKLRKEWLDGSKGQQETRAPFAALIATDDPEFIFQEAKSFAEWTTLIPSKTRKSDIESRSEFQGDKIRVGYVSPDFRNHAVCHLVNDLIKTHSRDQFEIFGYGISYYDQSECRADIASNFDIFYSLEQSKTTEIIKQIQSDKLDILVDLAGYTSGFIQTLFNRISGPLIVNYLGYPGTTGHPQYDYILGDAIVTPPENDKYTSERVVRLDCSYQCNSPSRKVTPVAFEDTGLPADSFIFCNFNSRQKINRETLLEWGKIVQSCPNSVLWLLDPGEKMQHEILKVLDHLESKIFFGKHCEISEHLGRVSHANLFLDSFPYGAHTTASDAVFRGVPVLARSGRAFQSRVAHSIIHHAGFPDLHATNWSDFYETAVSFYRDYSAEKQRDYRNSLLDFAQPRHPYNIKWTTQQIESAYRMMLA